MNLRNKSQQGFAKILPILLLASVVILGSVWLLYNKQDNFSGEKVTDKNNLKNHNSKESNDDRNEKNNKKDGQKQIPKWIEDNYPIYPNSKLNTITKIKATGDDKGYTMGFLVTGDSEEVAQWYHNAYEKAGWQYDNVNQEKRFNATKDIDGENHTTVISVNKAGSNSIVTITANRL